MAFVQSSFAFQWSKQIELVTFRFDSIYLTIWKWRSTDTIVTILTADWMKRIWCVHLFRWKNVLHFFFFWCDKLYQYLQKEYYMSATVDIFLIYAIGCCSKRLRSNCDENESRSQSSVVHIFFSCCRLNELKIKGKMPKTGNEHRFISLHEKKIE